MRSSTWSTAGILASWCVWSLAVALWAYVVYHVGGELVQVLALAVPVALTAGLFIGASPSPWADRRRAPLQGAHTSPVTPAPPPEQPKTASIPGARWAARSARRMAAGPSPVTSVTVTR